MKKLMRNQKCRVALALCAFLIAGVLCGVISHANMNRDVTPNHIVTPDDALISAAKAVSEPVTLTYVAQEGAMNLYVAQLISNVAALNGNITASEVSLNDAAADRLSARTGVTLAEGNVVVSSAKRAVALTDGDMYAYTVNEMMYYYTGQVVYDSADFTVQQALLSAINYVTRDDMPTLYTLTGHGEGGWDSELSSICFANGIDVRELNLSAAGGVPEDAAAILICNPTAPMSEGDMQALSDYMAQGGHMLLLTGYTSDTSGLDELLSRYGMSRVKGLVMDNDASHIYSADYPYFLRPDILPSDVTGSLIDNGQTVLVPVAEGIEPSGEDRVGLVITPILRTSENAYLKPNTDAVATLDMEETDIPGQYTLGMMAQEGDSQLVWIGSTAMISTTNSTASSGGNTALITSVFSHMFDFPARSDETARSTSLLTAPANISGAIGLACMIAPPVLLLVIGLILSRKRRK